MRNPVHSFFCTRRYVKLGLQSPSSLELWSDAKFEFSETECPDPDPRESQICLMGCYSCVDLKKEKVGVPDHLFFQKFFPALLADIELK